MTNTVEKILRELRGAHGLTAEDIAARIGATPVTLSRWKTGVSNPRAKALQALIELHAELMQTAPEKSPVSNDRDGAIVRMHRLGYAHPEIAEIFGITRERVRQIIKEHNEAPRRG